MYSKNYRNFAWADVCKNCILYSMNYLQRYMKNHVFIVINSISHVFRVRFNFSVNNWYFIRCRIINGFNYENLFVVWPGEDSWSKLLRRMQITTYFPFKAGPKQNVKLSMGFYVHSRLYCSSLCECNDVGTFVLSRLGLWRHWQCKHIIYGIFAITRPYRDVSQELHKYTY
jgi:hypothetical protein